MAVVMQAGLIKRLMSIKYIANLVEIEAAKKGVITRREMKIFNFIRYLCNNQFLKFILLATGLILVSSNCICQKILLDSVKPKEGFAVAELGGASGLSLTNGKFNFGPSFAVEITPIENWLELELGVTPAFGENLNEVDIDLLIKKPFTFSQKVEFMFGVGPVWTHSNENNVKTNSIGGEFALDFMFWPHAKHKFGWYLEPEYEYNFNRSHEQSIGISGGLLISFP